MDSESGWNQMGLAGIERDGRIDAGAQVQTRSTIRGILRQLIAHAGIENLDIYLHDCRNFVISEGKQYELQASAPG